MNKVKKKAFYRPPAWFFFLRCRWSETNNFLRLTWLLTVFVKNLLLRCLSSKWYIYIIYIYIYMCRLECLNRIQWSWVFKSHSGQLSIATSNNASVVNTIIYIYIYIIHLHYIYIYYIYVVKKADNVSSRSSYFCGIWALCACNESLLTSSYICISE